MKHSLPTHWADRSITVAVAGAGGNGSQILSGLARMHLALRELGHDGFQVHVFDPDIVTEANVGRQLFSLGDVGENKAVVLVHRLNCFFGLRWTAHPVPFKRGVNGVDLLIGCVDSAAARRELAQGRWTYWLDLGNTEKKGQVILGTKTNPKPINRYEEEIKAKQAAGWTPSAQENVIINKTMAQIKKLGVKSPMMYQPPRPKLVTEIFPELKNKRLKEDNAPSCSLAQALARQDLFINQTVATFALQLLWQFIRQGGLDIHGYFINLESGRVAPLPIIK